MARVSWVSYDYQELFDLKMIEGRFYSEKYKTDYDESIIINQSIVNMLGWESAIGKTFYLYEDKYTVIGVVEDFHSFPLSMGGDGLIFPFSEVDDYIFIKTIPGKTSNILEYINEVHDELNPAYPFTYEIFDDYIDPIYENLDTLSPTMLGFTLLGIIISCLGLYGLATYTTERRAKEIGIRKALGSSVLQIMKMLTFENIKLILISFFIAFPLGYLIMSFLLKNLSSKTNLSPAIFFGTAGIVLAIVFISIGFQSYKSAIRNPAESLRYE
jgi:ABC-type antimicrobial peptide transport system permease subunit